MTKSQEKRRARAERILNGSPYKGDLRDVFEGQCPTCRGRLDATGICAACELKWEGRSEGDHLVVSGSTRMTAIGGSSTVWRIYSADEVLATTVAH